MTHIQYSVYDAFQIKNRKSRLQCAMYIALMDYNIATFNCDTFFFSFSYSCRLVSATADGACSILRLPNSLRGSVISQNHNRLKYRSFSNYNVSYVPDTTHTHH
jgi:hypothetical protein